MLLSIIQIQNFFSFVFRNLFQPYNSYSINVLTPLERHFNVVWSLSFAQKYFGVILNRVVNYSPTYFYCYIGFKSDHVFSFQPRKNLWKHWNEMIDDIFNRSICEILKEKLVLRSSFDSKLGRGKWESKMKYLYHVKLFSKSRLVIFLTDKNCCQVEPTDNIYFQL